ncbi:hypothetical protein [Halobacterium sp. R2-5]|uniref:hypothetical protein n=1 Tax=Halobacterium sp. R2-5 TaxID=2715751 RepID=UPI00141D93A9|nr:hypothetical protein [Halobacterium sp. R2-5]NIC00341.1 hypothetical protein [Halobacterium sp. R2-5]
MVAVSYYCPRCGAVAELDRDAYLADKSVTPFPLEGWTYVSPSDDYESEGADGVKFVCGRDSADWSHPPREAERGEASTDGARSDATRDEPGCGEPFYLNFVRYEDGEEVSGQPESEFVQLAEGMAPSGPQGPSGPEFSR